MKIIFLDIDGVLNTNRSISLTENQNTNKIIFDAEAMNNLKEIVEKTQSKIVISSSWRIHYKTHNPLWISLKKNFKQYAIYNKIIDITDINKDSIIIPRWKQIKNWIDNNKELIDSYIIIDDEWFMGELQDNFIRCSSYTGINKKNKEDAIKILEK